MTTLSPIAVRSDFSIGESLLTVKEIPQIAKELGYESIIITDTMSVSSLISLSNAAKKLDIKVVIGCRLRIVNDPTDKTPLKKRENPQDEFYIKVYVKNDEGLKALYRLLSLANDEDHFYYVPRLGFEEVLTELRGGNLIVSTGDMASVFHHPHSKEYIERLKDAAGASQTFLELVPIQTPLFDTLNEKVISAALRSVGDVDMMPLLVSRPAFYKTPDDADTTDVLSVIASNSSMDAPWRPIQQVRNLHYMGAAELIECVKRSSAYTSEKLGYDTGEEWRSGLKSSERLVSDCAYVWGKQEVSLPQMAADESGELVKLIQEGWNRRLMQPQMGYQPSDLTEYKERLVHEVRTLRQMGFERYFLLVHDLVKWSKDNGILVGPGRGSVGGSLIAYLLGITDVDPLRFKLFFERFINPERLDLPDADLDFMSSRRGDVIKYLNDRYGYENVAGISNYSTMASASALRDVARVSGIPDVEYSCTKLVPKVFGSPVSLEEARVEVGEIEEFASKYPKIWATATKLQGKMRSLGQHAAGIVVAGEPIVNRAVIEKRKDGMTVNWDKRVVEDQGLVKMDILGLSTLDVLKIAADKIEQRWGQKIDYMALPLDDDKVLEAFGRGNTIGVFQFESPGMQKLLRDLAQNSPLTFDDIAAATALYRPGPVQSGLMDRYVGVKQGYNYAQVEHPAMENALTDTYGVIVYQESIMQIARDLAGFTMAQADHLRKAMGKKDAEKMAQQRQGFISGAIAGFVEIELEDGSIKKVHRASKLMCADGVRRTPEQAFEDCAEITSFEV